MIKIIPHYIRRFLDAYRDTIRINQHFNLVKLNGFFIIVKLFIIRFFYSFSFIRNYKRIIYTNKKMNSDYFLQKELNISEEIKQIDKLGYSQVYNINDSLKKELLDMVFDSKSIDFKKLDSTILDVSKVKEESLEEYFVRLKEKKISRLTGYLDLNKQSILKDFLTSKEILSIVKDYLVDPKFVSINATFFISNPVDATEKKRYSNGQFFHWDNDLKKVLKFYIYLTDVDADSGPHVFVEESHKFKKRQHRLCRLFNDDNIYNSYKNVKEFHGKSGSAFFEDSYGLHKGKIPKKKSRILLNIHFGSGKILYSKNDITLNLA